MSIRGLVERMSRGIVLRRRLPAEFGRGRLYVSPENGGLRYWRRDLRQIDPMLMRMANDFVTPGAVVWDIGANLGLFTFAASFKAGPKGFVLGVEPDVENAALLARSNRSRDPDTTAPVEILTAAIGGPGQRVAKFQIAQRARTANALVGFGSTQAGGWRETRPVPLLTLDELLDAFPPPKVIKIDVEGAEVHVLSGGSRLLSQVRPTILCEVSEEPENRDRIARLFAEHRFTLYDYDAPADRRAPLTAPAWSTLAVPQ